MKKFKLSIFLDTLTVFVLLFAITFIWFRYLFKNFYLSFFLALFLSFSIIAIQKYLRKKKQTKLKIKKDIETHIIDCADAFLFNTFNENATFFKDMLNEKYNIEIRTNFLLLRNKENTIALFLAYETKKLSQDKLIDCLRSVKELNLTKIIILCYDYELNVATISSNYKVKTLVLNKVQTYNEILCVFKKFPEKNSFKKIDEKITFSFLVRNALSKKKIKTYFWGGMFLLLASFVIRYNIYYIIFASIMFTLSLLCFILNKYYFKSNSEIL